MVLYERLQMLYEPKIRVTGSFRKLLHILYERSYRFWTPPPPLLTKNFRIRAWCPGTNIFGGVELCWCCTGKKLNFDLKTPSPGSGEVGEGSRRGGSQHFFRHVRASHTLLGKLALFPHRPQIPESSRIDVRIRGELYFFNSFVMFYDSVTK